ncbi:MAG: hypothetical protein NVS4B2_21540 [Chloroflexota bacterium]
MNLLGGLRERTHKSLILVTHDSSIAARCDRTVMVQDGHFVDESTPS